MDKQIAKALSLIIGEKLEKFGSQIETAVQSAIQSGRFESSFSQKHLAELTDKIERVATHLEKWEPTDDVRTNSKIFEKVMNVIGNLEKIPEIKIPEFPKFDFSSLEEKLGKVIITLQNNQSAIKSVQEAVRAIPVPEQKEIDLSPLIAKLSDILNETKKDYTSGLCEKMDAVLMAVKSIKMEFPKTWKIDEDQFRYLKLGSGGTTVVSAGGGGGSRMNATMVTQANTSLTANTEAAYVFPSNTVNFVIKLRAQNAKLFYAWATGTLPTSGTGALYFTAPQGFIRGQNDVEFSGRTIYIQSDVTTVAEIEVYRL